MKKIIQQFILVSALGVAFSTPSFATEITVYKSPTCGCCKEWVKHLQANGFSVKAHDVPDITAHKTANGVPAKLASCHTAKVDGYVIEGQRVISNVC